MSRIDIETVSKTYLGQSLRIRSIGSEVKTAEFFSVANGAGLSLVKCSIALFTMSGQLHNLAEI
jgi:hypothetical protein